MKLGNLAKILAFSILVNTIAVPPIPILAADDDVFMHRGTYITDVDRIYNASENTVDLEVIADIDTTGEIEYQFGTGGPWIGKSTQTVYENGTLDIAIRKKGEKNLLEKVQIDVKNILDLSESDLRITAVGFGEDEDVTVGLGENIQLVPHLTFKGATITPAPKYKWRAELMGVSVDATGLVLGEEPSTDNTVTVDAYMGEEKIATATINMDVVTATDTEPPKIFAVDESYTRHKDSVELTVRASDDKTRNEDLQYSFNGEGFSSNNKYTVSENGRVEIEVMDAAENIAPKMVEVTELVEAEDRKSVV